MKIDTILIAGILIGVCIACLCFFFVRDFILSRMINGIQIKARPADDFSEALKKDINMDILLIKDIKKAIETILGADVELNQSNVESFNILLTTINKRLESLIALGFNDDNDCLKKGCE